uniref:Uncharacterized protein n=1 Tax=Hucho hucho TaxID=62062 RepID=A0A4W5LFV4_9TELE
VVDDITEFYKQTYNNYISTKQEALKETLRLIHFGLNCCGLTGTVIDSARETCPKKEGLEALITTVTNITPTATTVSVMSYYIVG